MLDDIRVLSFTHFLQGPSASQILGDLGADVIKVESPNGAFERHWSGPDAFVNGISVHFMSSHRNVRSLAIDLKASPARDLILSLVDEVDVVIENFRPGAMARLGLDDETLRARNPRLVYCALSGYGADGPYRDRPGQDLLIQSHAGLAGATGAADAAPTPVGASIVDQHGAVLAVVGILAALRERDRTGRGSRVDSSLLSAALDLQMEPLSYVLNGFRGSRSQSGISSMFYKAPYGVFKTSNGFLCISVTPLPRLAEAFGDPWFDEHSDASYAEREAVNSRIASHISGATTADWLTRLAAAGVWVAPVNNHDDVIADEQVNYNRSFIELNHPQAGPIRVVGHPLRFDGEQPPIRRQPPAIGQHTREVLRAAGVDDQTIDHLVKDGVVAAAEPAEDPTLRHVDAEAS